MKNVFGSILLAVVLGAGSVLGDDAFDRARPFRKMTVMAGSISNGVCLMTDYRPKSTDVIRARFRLLRLDGQNRTLFCARSSMDDATALAYFASMKTTKHSRFDLGGTQYAGEVDLNTNDVYDVVYDGRIHLSSQGTELEVKGPETVPAWTAPTPLFLFASYTVADTGEIDNVGNFAHLEFYSFEIFSSTDPSSLLHKYVPACDEDGTACVADLVTRRLLYGTGSTPTMGFKLDEADALTGPVLPPGYATAEYLQSHGTEYVDLGVKFNGMWTYTLVFSPDASDLTCGVFGARHTSPAGVEAIAMYSQLHHSLFGIDMHGRLFDSGARVTFSGTRPDTPYRAVISSETCTIEPGLSPNLSRSAVLEPKN